MPLLTMRVTTHASKDGLTVETFVEGETYDIPDPLASMLVHNKQAEAPADFVPMTMPGTAPFPLARTHAEVEAMREDEAQARAAADANTAAEGPTPVPSANAPKSLAD